MKTPKEALQIIERIIKSAETGYEITGWRADVSGFRGLWRITAKLTIGGKTKTAIWNIVGRKVVARNALAAEVAAGCE